MNQKTKRRKTMNDKMLWDNIDDLRLISQKLLIYMYILIKRKVYEKVNSTNRWGKSTSC